MQTQAMTIEERPWYYRCNNGHEFGRPRFLRGHRNWPRGPGAFACPQCESYDFKQVFWPMGFDKVDGTYPLDRAEDHHRVWETVRGECEDGRECGYCDTCRGVMSPLEASRFLGVPLHPTDLLSLHNNSWQRYLFLNKGFLILAPEGRGLHPDREKRRVQPMLMAALEVVDAPHQARGWPVGTRALYVHDGKYYLIEKHR